MIIVLHSHGRLQQTRFPFNMRKLRETMVLPRVVVAAAACFLLTAPAGSAAVPADSGSTQTWGWIAYPYLFYSPESNLAFGVGGIVYARLSPDTVVKSSSITPSAYYSINGQFDVTVIPEFYFSRTMYIYGNLSFGNYIDKYYGTGPESPEIAEPEYKHDSIILEGHVQPQLDDIFRAGVFIRYFQRNISDPQKNPLLQDPATVGRSGGQSTGLGFILSWDSRDNGFYPVDGSLNKLKVAYYDEALGSDFTYTRYEADLRAYKSLDEAGKHVVGLQGYGVFVTGAPPFYDLALMGGKTIMRGYYQGRYRDKALLAGQAEYRYSIFERFRVVSWLGTGQVAPSLEGIRMRALQYSYGFGIRYVFDLVEQLDIRADIGFGKGTTGAYFDIQQAF